MGNLAYVPKSRFLDQNGYVSIEWLLWLQNPSITGISITSGLGPSSGGTGSTLTPAANQIAVGNGSAYEPTTTLPTPAFPALTGDVSTPAGSVATTLATVNSNVGSWGSGTNVGTFTVNAKGLVTAAGDAAITGSPGSFTATTGFGCNGKAAQTSATANAAIASTAGAAYTATEQTMLNDLKALVNQIRAALIADGIMV